jgi:hypothetical protein
MTCGGNQNRRWQLSDCREIRLTAGLISEGPSVSMRLGLHLVLADLPLFSAVHERVMTRLASVISVEARLSRFELGNYDRFAPLNLR